MLPKVSARQLGYLQRGIENDKWYRDEQVWTFLIAAILAEDPRHIRRFCAEQLELPVGGEVWCEAEPISTRSGSDEGNTVEGNGHRQLDA